VAYKLVLAGAALESSRERRGTHLAWEPVLLL